MNWPLVVRRHERLAIRGSVRSAEFLLKVRVLAMAPSRYGAESATGVATPSYTVNVLVPRPPDTRELD